MPKSLAVERMGWIRAQQERPNDCWLWPWGRVRGYGQTRHNGKHCYVHRWAYELLVGPIPPTMTLDHLCRNPACANPRHLEPVTIGVNVLRGLGPTARHARKTRCINGHPFNETNTIYRPTGGRYCRECRRASSRRARKLDTLRCPITG
jgi:hypothetical protein